MRRYLAGIAAFGMLAGTMLPAGANVQMRRFDRLAPQAERLGMAAVPRSMFPSRDFGRRLPQALVSATVTLRYNRQAELDALVRAQSNPRSPLYRHFLTSAQFNNYFAPTPQQEAYVVATLQAAGLRVTQRFPNRTLVDVVGTSAATERFFHTEIHSLSQGVYGERFANVTPALVPANLTSLVRTVSLSNLIVAKTGPRLASRPMLATALASQRKDSLAPGRFTLPSQASNIEPFASNVVKDPGFESGGFKHGWGQCETEHASPLASITKKLAHSGKYSGFAGSLTTKSREQYGFAGVCQLVKIPNGGNLTAYLYQLTDDKYASLDGEDAFLIDTHGYLVAILASSANNHAGWERNSWNLSSYAGRNLYLYFGVHGDGNAHHHTQQYVDDVSLTGSGPKPTPTPTAHPTASPSAKPSASPTAHPSASPSVSPTVLPTSSPTASPTASPTTAPTTSPTTAPTTSPTTAPTTSPTTAPTTAPTSEPVTCNNSAPDGGPLSNGNGYLATGVADAFDYPVQHGCNGAGTTVAVEISSPVVASDIAAYLSASGVTQTGTITDIKIDGGGTLNDGANDEASLDVETISGLAPGANILIYDFPDLSDQHIEDGYNKTVSDNLASVTNSSFGGCENSDVPFEQATESIAEQGAVKGITFVASSGDSGSDECGNGNNPPLPSEPAGDTYFVSLGGVNFTESPSGTLLTLTAQGDLAGTGFLSGGGVSTVVGLPTYQNGVANIIKTGRNQPDVSLPGVGVAVYFGGGDSGDFDGTSWSSPCFVGLLADAIEVNNGTRFGFLNPTIYSVFQASSYTDFTDVTAGTNGYYQALSNYDQVTGIGAPKGYAFSLAI